MKYKIGIVFNESKKQTRLLAGELSKWLATHGCAAVLLPSSALKKPAAVDFVLALGGDGTLLKTARIFAPKDIPVKGINLGTLGFLTDVDKNQAQAALLDILTRGLKVENRQLFTAEFVSGGKKIKTIFVNDCVTRSAFDGRLVSLDAFVNGRFIAEYKCDGIIVSTPMGSTAYSLAASGAIVYPSLSVALLTPICPHTLAQRPMILPSDVKIMISTKNKIKNRKVVVSIDGQENYSLPKGESVKIAAYPQPLKIIKNAGADYFETLRKKLNWGV
jgi:NAD+ kinase